MKKCLYISACLLIAVLSAGAATFTVSSSADAGPNTLRQCLLDANSSTPPNEIVFTIGSPYIISPLSALPFITNQVDINAAIGYPDPTVSLDGSSAGAGVTGLRIQYTAGCSIKGLRIYNFEANGIYINQAQSNTIQRCTIYSNSYGINMLSASYHLIGGDADYKKNTISGNRDSGVRLSTGCVSNQISGNFIGTDEAGDLAWSNSSHGVFLYGAVHTLIGGVNTVPGGLFPGNLISGNGLDGIQLGNPDGQTLVQGNLIGTSSNGVSAIPNGNAGIVCYFSPSNVIGGAAATMRNTISGNALYGVYLQETQTAHNVVIGNYIGTDKDGTVAVPNGHDGVFLLKAPNNRIGGPGIEGNLLSGNGATGLRIMGFSGNYGATGTVVQGNFIGTDVTGLLRIPNEGTAGLRIECSDTLVGGTNAGNVIAGNIGYGVYVLEEGHRTTILGNWIGPYDASLSTLSNGYDGIFFYEVGEAVIGGTNLLDRNIISGNGQAGINLYGSNCVGTVIAGNFIGLDASGSAAVGNQEQGIRIYNGQSNQIGMASSGGQNLISGNGADGIAIEGHAHTLYNNFIGTDASGSVAIENGWNGVHLVNSRGCKIGGYDSMEENLISGNGLDGIVIEGGGSTSNEIQGNWIGCDITRTNALGNGSYGVRFTGGAYSNLVGGGSGSDANVMSFNGADGLYVDSGSHGIAIVGNSFYFNGQLGIDLYPGGPTTNDPLDADSGANGLQNFPILTSVTNNGTAVLVSGYLESEPSKEYWVEFFFNRSCDPTGYGEGEYVMALVSNMMTDGTGFAVFTNLPLVLHDPPPDFLTATASDLALWNTSEFSPFILLDSDGDGMGDGYEDEYFGHYTGGDPLLDLDSDGALNGEEFDADTDPSDAESLFKIAGMSNQPTETLVGVESSRSRQYAMQRQYTINTNAAWIDFTGWDNGTGGVLIFTHYTVYTTQFYRAVARIPEIE